MPVIRSVVKFPLHTGLPEDSIVNTWHFYAPVGPVEAADFAEIGVALNQFYTQDTAGAGTAIDNWCSPQMFSGALPRVTHYTVELGGTTGSPEAFSDILNWTPNSPSNPLPTEVAVCLSFRGDLEDVPEQVPLPPAGPGGDLRLASRRRGRIFLGGLSSDASGGVAPNIGRPLPGLRTTITAAAARLRDHAGLQARGLNWCVYSRQADTAYDVVSGWVDNAFDTQRRRGLTPNARTTF